MEEQNHQRQTGPLKIIFLTALIAGTLDAVAAMVVYQIPPIPLFKFIASGAFGKETFSGGQEMVIAGVVFHYFIALSWSVLFFLIYPKIRFLSRHSIISGLLYGVVVWVIMNLAILPMTKVPQRPFDLRQAIIGAVILMFMIGLPISLLIHRYHSTKKVTKSV
jgi:uncharacterized membrane protein YagU involved in acid resistance